MASSISANKAELLAIANSVASEKMIDKAIVIEAMEEAIQKAARARYGNENDIRAIIVGRHGIAIGTQFCQDALGVYQRFRAAEAHHADSARLGDCRGHCARASTRLAL